MNKLLLMIPLLAMGVGMAYAEPLERVDTVILDYDGDVASVQISWTSDESAKKYEIGCVSCSPNTKFTIIENDFVMKDVSPFPNTSKALLYIIAFDSDDEMINAKQIMIDLEKRSSITHNEN